MLKATELFTTPQAKIAQNKNNTPIDLHKHARATVVLQDIYNTANCLNTILKPEARITSKDILSFKTLNNYISVDKLNIISTNIKIGNIALENTSAGAQQTDTVAVATVNAVNYNGIALDNLVIEAKPLEVRTVDKLTPSMLSSNFELLADTEKYSGLGKLILKDLSIKDTFKYVVKPADIQVSNNINISLNDSEHFGAKQAQITVPLCEAELEINRTNYNNGAISPISQQLEVDSQAAVGFKSVNIKVNSTTLDSESVEKLARDGGGSIQPPIDGLAISFDTVEIPAIDNVLNITSELKVPIAPTDFSSRSSESNTFRGTTVDDHYSGFLVSTPSTRTSINADIFNCKELTATLPDTYAIRIPSEDLYTTLNADSTSAHLIITNADDSNLIGQVVIDQLIAKTPAYDMAALMEDYSTGDSASEIYLYPNGEARRDFIDYATEIMPYVKVQIPPKFVSYIAMFNKAESGVSICSVPGADPGIRYYSTDSNNSISACASTMIPNNAGIALFQFQRNKLDELDSFSLYEYDANYTLLREIKFNVKDELVGKVDTPTCWIDVLNGSLDFTSDTLNIRIVNMSTSGYIAPPSNHILKYLLDKKLS